MGYKGGVCEFKGCEAVSFFDSKQLGFLRRSSYIIGYYVYISNCFAEAVILSRSTRKVRVRGELLN